MNRHRWGKQEVRGPDERLLVSKRCKDCGTEYRVQFFGPSRKRYYWIERTATATDIRPNCRAEHEVSGVE